MSPRGTPIGPVRLGVSAVLIGAGAVVVADQTKLTATRALTGGFFIKPGLSAAFQYGGIALIGLGALLIIIGALASADPGAVATLRRATVTLEVLVVLVGVLVYLGYRHANDQQQQPAQSVATTDTTTTDTTPSTTTATPVPFVINCNLDSSGKPTSTCSYPDGPPPAAAGTTTPPPPGKDPLTANCTDLGRTPRTQWSCTAAPAQRDDRDSASRPGAQTSLPLDAGTVFRHRRAQAVT